MLRRIAFALAPLTAAVLWGGMYVVSKWGFDAIPPVTLGFLRVVFGALTLFVVVKIGYPNRSFSQQDWKRLVFLGFWVTATLVTQFVGTDLTNASQGALLTVLTPIFTLLLGVVALSEPLTGRRTFGMILATIGTIVVIAGQYDLNALTVTNVAGVTSLVVASFAWSAYTVWGKPLVRKYSALETATYSTIAATPMLAVLVPIEFALGGYQISSIPITLPVAAAVLYLGVLSTAAAWYLWYKGLEFVDAGTVAVFFFAQPVVGAALGAIFLGETLGPAFITGGVIMATGIYIVSTAGLD